MKLTAFFILVSLFQIQANITYGQKTKISLDLENVSVERVLDEIETLTEFKFFINVNQVDLDRVVSVKVAREKVSVVLNDLFKNRNVSYKLIDRQIVLKRKIQNADQIAAKSSIIQESINGKVSDSNGEPMFGVTVMVKDSKKGTFTDNDGNYSIEASKGEVLSFSMLGMVTVEVTIEDNTEINVILKEDSQSLEEVVLMGYGTQKRKQITGSVSKVDVAGVNKLSSISFDNALVGKASGVHVVTGSGAPGSSASIRIRGVTSIFGNNEPLYVIDGLPIEIGQGLGNSYYSESFSQSMSPLASINPQDIASIDILKDASATAIYGSRGANGVVIITTKKGSYSSVPGISISTTTSISNFTKKYDMLSADEYHSVVETAYLNAGKDIPDDEDLFPYGSDVNTNWQDATSQNAINTNYYLNLNGGSLNGSTLYSLSAGITDQKGAIDKTKFGRNNLRAKLETKLSNNLRVGMNINYSDSKNEGSRSTFYYQTIMYRPDIPIYDEDGVFAAAPGSNQANPYSKVRYPSYVDNENLRLSLFAEYELAKGLLFKSTYSFSDSDTKSFKYTPSYDVFEIQNNRKGTLDQSDRKFTSRILDNTLTFRKSVDKHNLNSVAGISYTQNKSEFLNIKAIDFPDDDVMVTPGAAGSQTLTSGGTISGLSSYFVRANYNYDDKYYLTFTGRADKSTKFGPNNRWGYFPSGAIAWRISREQFLEDSEVINDIKIRASYGKTGSANFSDFQYATFFAPGNFYNNNNGVVSNTIPNPDIKWETTNQLDIAVDYSLFDRRVNGSIGYFNKKTSDQILYRDVILETGGSNQFANIGDFLNKGFEFQVGVDVYSKEKFQWITELNLTSIKSKVLKLNGGYYRTLIEGEPVSYFEGYKVAGIFQNQEEIDALNEASSTGVYQSSKTAPGDFKYVDLNGDGYIGDEDADIIGKAEPDFYGGWNNIFRFGNFEVSTLFNFSVGNYLFNSNKRDLLIFDRIGNNYEKGILNAWTPENTDTNLPRLIERDPNNNQRNSDFFIENASFLKLKNIHLTYKFNPDLLKKFLIKRASVSLSASNLFVITSYSGLDPEVGGSASNFGQGYDSASYPQVRTFTLGFNLNL